MGKLKAWRVAQDRSVSALAKEIGCSRVAWYDWEEGRRVPQARFMEKLHDLTGGAVEPNDFYPTTREAA